MSERLAFDIETDGLLHELTRIWVLGIGCLDTGEVTTYTDHDPAYPPLAAGLARLQAAHYLVAHNGITFDVPAIEMVTGIRLNLGLLTDTLALGRLNDPQRQGGHKLEGYGVEMGLLKGHHDEWDRYSEEMRHYCAQDIRVTLALHEKLKHVLSWGLSPWIEHRTAYLIGLQMDNGFTLNVRQASILAAEFDGEVRRIEYELKALFPPIYVGAGEFVPKRDNAKAGYMAGAPLSKIELQEFNPGSEHHVARRLLRKYGWKAPLTEHGNPNITEAVLKKLDFPEAKTLVRHARVFKQWQQVASPPKKNGTGGGWLHHVKDDGRVHGYVNSNGAVTGRMTHSRPNSANIDKDAALRALWVPGVGFVLVGCDAEGLELRMLAHYLFPLDGGALMRALLEGDKALGTDAHSMNRKNTDLYSRDGAKTLLYGSLYGAGDEKAGAIWVADWRSSGKPIAEWPAWALVGGKLKPLKTIGKEVKRRLIDGITGYRKLIENVKVAAKRGWLKGLDGRKVRVLSEHAALNTLLQSAGAIVMKLALIRYHEAVTALGWKHGVDFGYCANVHDEVQQEVRPALAEQAGQHFKDAITRAGTELGVRCRLDGSFDIGTNWSETH